MSFMMFQHEIDAAVKGEPWADGVIDKLAYNRWFGSGSVVGLGGEPKSVPNQDQIDAFNKKLAERFEQLYGWEAFQKWAESKKKTNDSGLELVLVTGRETGRTWGVPLEIAKKIWECGWIMSIEANKKD